VKTARLLLLVLLAVLLPVRGALAAVMLCPPAGVVMQADGPAPHASTGHHGHAHADAPLDAAAAVHAHHHAEHGGEPGHGDASTSASDKCNVCAASCAMTPLAASAPALLAGPDPAPVVFPALRVPPLGFVSGGQDRPPRSS
jgi:hypothetical protein